MTWNSTHIWESGFVTPTYGKSSLLRMPLGLSGGAEVVRVRPTSMGQPADHRGSKTVRVQAQ